MSIEQTTIIDAISIDEVSNEVILTIADHLEWEPNSLHLELLQDKLNAYLSFIQSGEMEDAYPKAKGRKAAISLVAKHELDTEGLAFLAEVQQIVEGAGIRFEIKQLPVGAVKS